MANQGTTRTTTVGTPQIRTTLVQPIITKPGVGDAIDRRGLTGTPKPQGEPPKK